MSDRSAYDEAVAETSVEADVEADVTVLDSDGLTSREAALALADHGYNEVIFPELPVYRQILARFFGIVPLLFLITAVLCATVVSKCVSNSGREGICFCEENRDLFAFAFLVLELVLVALCDFFKARNSRDVMNMLQERSESLIGVMRDNKWIELPGREIVPGDKVNLYAGMKIPADGVICTDDEPIKLDYSALTGEPLPGIKKRGDSVLSGAVVLLGEAKMIVTKTGIESSFFATQVSIAQAKAEKESGGKLASILSKIVLSITLFGIIIVTILGIYITATEPDISLAQSVKHCFVLLTVILPVTMPLVLTTTLAYGSRELAKDNAVVQRFSAIPEMATMDILCSDKTGTLTSGDMTVVEDECVILNQDVTVEKMLELALITTRAEHGDAIDTAITKYFQDHETIRSAYSITKFVPFDSKTKKVTVFAKHLSTATDIVVVKGAPPVLLAFPGVSDETYAKANEILVEKSQRGFKTLAVSVQVNEYSWTLLGLISFIDPPRFDSAQTVKRCFDLGVKVKMITGDQYLTALEVGKQLKLPNLKMYNSDVFGANSSLVDEAGGFENLCEHAGGFTGVSPDHKLRVISALQGCGHFVGMTGDGVNDVPALAGANVGVAVAGATEAAKAASDIVLQQEGLSTIILAIYGSRKIFNRIEQYMIYLISSSGIFGLVFFLVFLVTGLAFPIWAMVGLKFLNDISVLTSSKDRVLTSMCPKKLGTVKVLTVAFIICVISSFQIWLFVHLLVVKNSDHKYIWGLASPLGFSGCEASSTLFLLMTITLQLNLLTCRTPVPFWLVSKKKNTYGYYRFVPRPKWWLLASIFLTLLLVTIISHYRIGQNKFASSGYDLGGMSWRNIFITWAWGLMWFLITDTVKSLTLLLWEVFENGMREEYADMYRNAFRPFSGCQQPATKSKRETLVQSIRTEAAELASNQLHNPSDQSMEDKFLSVGTLRADPGMLRVISSMSHTINEMKARLESLENKISETQKDAKKNE